MKKRVFYCDKKSCKKKIEIDEETEGFPYRKGWTYVFKMKIKYSSNPIKNIKIEDKHFCTSKHMVEYIENEIKKVEVKDGKCK